MENGDVARSPLSPPFFSEIGEWRMENGELLLLASTCGRFYYFSLGVAASFTWNPHYKKCMMDEETDFKSEHVNKA
jgi:hypothetical protein